MTTTPDVIAGRWYDGAVERLLENWFGVIATQEDLLRGLALTLGVPGPEALETAQLLEAIAERLLFCRLCGCTDAIACAGGCSWVGAGDLCSSHPDMRP